MKTLLTLGLLCLLSIGFSQKQHQLVRLGTTEKINAKATATNAEPLLVVQNVVYAIPVECFCDRGSGDDDSGRNLGDDDDGRNKDSRNANRNADEDDLNRNAGKDDSGRKSGTDFIYRDASDDDGGRGFGDDDSDRNLDSADADRNAGAADADRNAGAADANRDSDSAARGRAAGSAANDRDASGDSLGRGFRTSASIPSCYKIEDSCSIQILGFHPKSNVEYFDKIESIKAIEMVIEF